MKPGHSLTKPFFLSIFFHTSVTALIIFSGQWSQDKDHEEHPDHGSSKAVRVVALSHPPKPTANSEQVADVDPPSTHTPEKVDSSKSKGSETANPLRFASIDGTPTPTNDQPKNEDATTKAVLEKREGPLPDTTSEKVTPKESEDALGHQIQSRFKNPEITAKRIGSTADFRFHPA